MLPIKTYLNHPKYIGLSLLTHIGSRILPDKLYLRLRFRLEMGKWPNLDEPRTFSEKLQWLKLYDYRPEYTQMVDKYAVKGYVAEIIGEEYIIPTLGVWDRPDYIDFDSLPDQFVLKTTHGGGGNGVIVCNDKSFFDRLSAIKKLNLCFKADISRTLKERPYHDVPKRIIAEKYICESSIEGKPVDLTDYKVLCFNGTPKLIEVHKDRFAGQHKQDFYDVDWNLTEISQPEDRPIGYPLDKPACLDRMLELSATLAKDILHVRVDWYVIGNQLYFGEITFYDGSGFVPFMDESQDELLGSWISLPTDGGAGWIG